MRSILFSLGSCMTMASAASGLLIDDFSSLDSWRHKLNVTLALDDATLVARADFSKYRYAWFRKDCLERPLDLSAFEGLVFHTKGATGCDLLVHLMTGTAGNLTTYVTALSLVPPKNSIHTQNRHP